MNSPIPSSSIGKSAPTGGSGSPSIKPSLKSTDERKQEEASTIGQLANTSKTLFGQTTTTSDFASRVTAATAIGGVTGGIAGAAAGGMSQAMAMQSSMMKADLMKQAASGISELGSLGKLFEGMGKKNKGEEEESKRRIASNREWGSAGGKEA